MWRSCRDGSVISLCNGWKRRLRETGGAFQKKRIRRTFLARIWAPKYGKTRVSARRERAFKIVGTMELEGEGRKGNRDKAVDQG